MKFRLKVQVSKREWKTGIVVYDTFEEAQTRQKKLKSVHNINSIIVDEFGGQLK